MFSTRVLSIIADTLFVISIPLLLITSNLRGAVGEIRLYEYGYDKYNVSADTGIEREELDEIARGLIGYFNSGEEFTSTSRFNERELIHLEDVKNLIQFFYRFQEASVIYVVCYIIFSYYLQKSGWWRNLARKVVWGSGLTISLLLVLGIAVAVDFQQVFLWFHRISFNNLLWMMRPGDLLPRLYTEGFFFDGALFIVGATVVECLVIGGGSICYLVRTRKRSMAAIAAGGGAGAAGTGVQ